LKSVGRTDRIAAVTSRRVLTLLVGLGLALLCLTPSARAHPGHGPTDAALARDGLRAAQQSPPESESAAESWQTLGRHAPATAALLVAALALLASVSQRRRVLAVALVLLLSMVLLEGVLHATLHLQHVRHADGLAIGASPAQQAAADPDHPSAAPVMLLGEIVERYVAPAPDVVVASSRSRAPPVSPV
jgi:hypothetical protein